MNKQLVTSDSHFWHKNILKYQPNRKYENIREHNQALIDNWNSVVGPDDEIYHLGDFAFANRNQIVEILEQLNGIKYFLFGNHDKHMRDSDIARYFEWQKFYHELKVPGVQFKIPMFHYPIHSWNRQHYGALHFYGHTHCAIPTMHSGRGMDIGSDSNECTPWDVQDLVKLMQPAEVIDARKRDERDEYS